MTVYLENVFFDKAGFTSLLWLNSYLYKAHNNLQHYVSPSVLVSGGKKPKGTCNMANKK